MLIGIVSDTHGYFHPALPNYFEHVDLIIHAGDIGNEETLIALEAIAPVRAVYGNVDGWELRRLAPEHQQFEADGVRFWVTHIAGHPGRWQNNMGRKLASDPPDVFICGHSHILRIARVAEFGNMLYINPGAAGRQGFHQKKTVIRLSLSNGKPQQAEVIHLDD
jgi:putative phosphoesterase